MSRERLNPSGYVEDLSVLSRRGALPSAAEDSFSEALAGSATLQTAHRVGLDFDQIVEVRAGDDALIAEMAARAMSQGRANRRPHWLGRALLAAAALACAGSAAAWWNNVQPHASAAAASSAPVVARPAAVSPSHAITASTAVAPAPASSPPHTSGVESAPSHVEAGSSLAASRATPNAENSGAFASAEALFREANAARRAGDNAGARALYLRLQRDFPTSNEAELAHISLGNLLLRMGRAAEAEQQFARGAGSRGALAQEALVGRAQSLAALGRDADERQVWRTLLSSYPGSVYAAQAKQRLSALERIEPAKP